MGEITKTTRITPRGQTTIVVTPPRPCGLTGCVGELEVTIARGGSMRVHLDDMQRNELIDALGEVVVDLARLSDDARHGLIVALGGVLPGMPEQRGKTRGSDRPLG